MDSRMLRRGALLAILGFACVVFGLRVPQAYMSLRAKQEKVRELEQRNEQLRQENAKRRQWIEDLTKNSSEQESVLRERYHKQRNTETDNN